MGKRKLEDHRGYVEPTNHRHKLLSMMTKIRATQTLGATLTSKGSHERACKLYKKLINDALENEMRENFSTEHQNLLEDALAYEQGSLQEKAWKMRSAIDSVYDDCLLDYNDVKGAMPANLHSLIKETINRAVANIATGDNQAGFDKYRTLLEQLKNNKKYKELVSPAAQKLVKESLEIAESGDGLEVTNIKLRESLDRVYNEIRLPDVFAPSTGPQVAVNTKAKNTATGLLVVDFRQIDGSLFPYTVQLMDDKVMGGSSSALAALNMEEHYMEFKGELSRRNRGGFASFRILPSDKDEMRKVLSGTTAVSLEVCNLDTKNNRYKFQLANEAHLKSFNWQAEFVVEPNKEFQTIVLDIYSFWPTMFGHVLSSPGNVDFSKVDCLGLLISHVTVDGKSNPDFVEGSFGLAIRSIRFIKDEKDD